MNIDEEIIVAVAKAIEGPHNDLPAYYVKMTLSQLRDHRWNRLTLQEQNVRKNEARAAIKEFEKIRKLYDY